MGEGKRENEKVLYNERTLKSLAIGTCRFIVTLSFAFCVAYVPSQ